MSAEIEIRVVGLGDVSARIAALIPPMDAAAWAAVGAEIESQTRARIAAGGPDPDGEAWPPWSAMRAATRHGGHSLLIDQGHLLDSIQYLVYGGDAVEIGSNLDYSRKHQYADESPWIPQRRFLGLSADDAAEINGLLDDMIGARLP